MERRTDLLARPGLAVLLLVVALLAVVLPGASAQEGTEELGISGRVTSSLDGSPAVGVSVAVSLRMTEGGYYRQVDDTETDADGRYSFTLPPGSYSLTTRASLYFPWQTDQDEDVVLAEGGASAVRDVELRRMADLDGVVRAPDGEPVPDATVSLYSEYGTGWHPIQTADGRPVVRRTDADGRFQFEGYHPGARYALRAAAAGLAPSARPDGPDPGSATVVVPVPGPNQVEVRLQPADGELSGRVTTEGRPVEGVTAVVWREQPGGTVRYADVQTTADGTWATGVAAGSYRVQFRAEHLRWETFDQESGEEVTVTVPGPLASAVDADLEQAGSIVKGRVLADGRPIQEVMGGRAHRIQVEIGNHLTQLAPYQVTADTEGNYYIGSVPPGTYHLTATHYWANLAGTTYPTTYYPDTAVEEEATLVVLDGKETFVADLDIGPALDASPSPSPSPSPSLPPVPTPTPSDPLAGTVTGPRGAPLQGVVVTVEERPVAGSAWAPSTSERTDARGAWTTPTKAGHEYRVSFEHAGYRREWYRDASRAQDATAVPPGATGVDARLQALPWWHAVCDLDPPGLLGRLLRLLCGTR